jgi:hypothetical protein
MTTGSPHCLFLALLLSALATRLSAQVIRDSSHSDPMTRNLLSQPSGMLADITLADGTLRKSANILRVTTGFLAVQESELALPIFLAFDSATRLKEFHRPMLGSWESVNPRPEEHVDRLELRYGNNIGTVVVRDGWVYQEVAFIRTGRYHAEYGALPLNYDHSDAPVEDIRFRFECDQLIVETPNLIHLTLLWRRQDRTYPPLVGRWRSQGSSTPVLS